MRRRQQAKNSEDNRLKQGGKGDYDAAENRRFVVDDRGAEGEL